MSSEPPLWWWSPPSLVIMNVQLWWSDAQYSVETELHLPRALSASVEKSMRKTGTKYWRVTTVRKQKIRVTYEKEEPPL